MTSIAFHPHQMVLGCSSADGHLNVFQMGASSFPACFESEELTRDGRVENYRNAVNAMGASLSPLGIAGNTYGV